MGGASIGGAIYNRNASAEDKRTARKVLKRLPKSCGAAYEELKDGLSAYFKETPVYGDGGRKLAESMESVPSARPEQPKDYTGHAKSREETYNDHVDGDGRVRCRKKRGFSNVRGQAGAIQEMPGRGQPARIREQMERQPDCGRTTDPEPVDEAKRWEYEEDIMAGWINDYRMDCSPAVNALNGKPNGRAEERAFHLK